MFSAMDFIFFGCGALFTVLWLILLFMGLKHTPLFENLEGKEYPLKDIYIVGYAMLELVHYSYKSKKDRLLRKEAGILYGDKYADYYMRVIYAQKVSLGFTLFVLSFSMYGLLNTPLGTLVFLMMAWAAYYYYGNLAATKIAERSESMLSDFSNVVSKLALLTNAGMIMREAWEEVANNGETVIYQEMRRSVEEMQNGVSEIDALFRFGNRCMIPEVKKFTSTIIQGLQKGNSELTVMLQTQSGEVWELKKQQVRRQGEKAASKLMLPMMLMFVGILIMVIIPIFTNIGV